MSNFFDTTNRERFGQLVSVTGIVVNILLSGAKFFVGIMSGAISIIADAFNNLSDASTSLVILMGFGAQHVTTEF